MLKKLKMIALLCLIPMAPLQAADDEPNIGLDNVCVIVKRIEFNHKDGITGDAYDIRKNATTELAHSDPGKGGEWTYGGRREEVLYHAGQTSVTVKVQFQATDPQDLGLTFPFSVKIKALPYLGKMCNLTEQTITFNSWTSPWYEFTCEKDPYEWDANADKDISKTNGWWEWRVKNTDGTDERRMHWTNHKVFCILEAGIQTPWKQDDSVKEPWVSALEFAVVTAGTSGKKTPPTAISQVTTYCHGSHGLTYENKSGAPAYMGGGWTTAFFDATKYMTKGNGNKVNCHDQVLAVDTFAGLVGVPTTWYYINKLGYSATTQIVGGYNMNNPFNAGTFTGTPFDVAAVVGTDALRVDADTDGDIDRSYFGNHGIADYSSKVYDACVGAHLGTETHAQYMTAAQDTTTAPEAAVKGTAANFQNKAAHFTTLK